MNIASAADKALETAPEISLGFWSSLIQASFFVQLTVVILIAMSVFSWAIIASQYKKFKFLKKINKVFLKRFEKVTSLEEVEGEKNAFRASPLLQVFETGYKELNQIVVTNMNEEQSRVRLQDGLDNIKRSLEKAIDNEIIKIEDKTNFLATIGNSAPFIGLFGTVLGIISSFQKIAIYQSASLSVVAPGLSEALYATAIGLFVAIPASMAYNHFLAEIRAQEIELNNFSKDFLNLVKRNFYKAS